MLSIIEQVNNGNKSFKYNEELIRLFLLLMYEKNKVHINSLYPEIIQVIKDDPTVINIYIKQFYNNTVKENIMDVLEKNQLIELDKLINN